MKKFAAFELIRNRVGERPSRKLICFIEANGVKEARDIVRNNTDILCVGIRRVFSDLPLDEMTENNWHLGHYEQE